MVTKKQKKHRKGQRRQVDVMIKFGDGTQMYINHGEKIRITETQNQLKKIIAREVSVWMNAPSRYWSFNGSIDRNSKRLFEHLMDKFPDYMWVLNHSQGTFDIVSLDAKVAIELKSAKVGSKKLVTNASIYPDKVKARYALSKGYKWGKFSPDDTLDVLVVCVERNEKDKVYNYAIVDGSYWGVTEEDFVACHDLYNQLNNKTFKKKLLKLIMHDYENSFLEKLTDDIYGDGIELDFRKLIHVSNPVGRLNTSGWWHVG